MQRLGRLWPQWACPLRSSIVWRRRALLLTLCALLPRQCADCAMALCIVMMVPYAEVSERDVGRLCRNGIAPPTHHGDNLATEQPSAETFRAHKVLRVVGVVDTGSRTLFSLVPACCWLVFANVPHCWQIDEKASFATAFTQVGLPWGQYLVGLGATLGEYSWHRVT